jgi:hypothetical protein
MKKWHRLKTVATTVSALLFVVANVEPSRADSSPSMRICRRRQALGVHHSRSCERHPMRPGCWISTSTVEGTVPATYGGWKSDHHEADYFARRCHHLGRVRELSKANARSSAASTWHFCSGRNPVIACHLFASGNSVGTPESQDHSRLTPIGMGCLEAGAPTRYLFAGIDF